MKRTHTRHSSAANRAGFSLVELLVVIVIIAILMALLVPAVQSVRLRARLASVSAEISQLDQAITKFKNTFNVEPPSSVYIPVAGGTWDAADRSKIRSIWPQFDFANRGGMDASLPDYHLNGAECLVFFLGGVQTGGMTAPAVIGFSKDPRNPWSGTGSNREGPFFEFDGRRIVDVDDDGVFEYVDPLPDQRTPYLYLSSQGRSYNKVNDQGELDDFDVHGGPANGLDMRSIYAKTMTTNPNPTPPPMYLPGEPHRPNGYQIISPGVDGLYGIGGGYTDGSELTGDRSAEADNITNFGEGVLGR